jgi:sugar lactone lactonase YvrE
MTAGPRQLAARPAGLRVPVAQLGEGPRWDAGSQSLYWVDIPAGYVHRLNASGVHACWQAGQPVSAVAVRAAGGLVLAARDGFLALDQRSGAVSLLAAVEPGRPDNRMNDGACDRAGRMFAGTKAEDETPGAGALYRLDPDHQVTTVLTGVTISNGIGWSPDESLMYYIDSPTRRIDVLDYDPATGAVAARRTFAEITGGEAIPDGLTVDAEGCVWVALWDGGAVLRYSPGGQVSAIVTVPVPQPTSCAFGGPTLDVLYITTAAARTRPDGTAGPGGELFACRPGPPGLPANPYRG